MPERVPFERQPRIDSLMIPRELPAFPFDALEARVVEIERALGVRQVRDMVDAQISLTRTLHNAIRATAMQRVDRGTGSADPLFPRAADGTRDNTGITDIAVAQMRNEIDTRVDDQMARGGLDAPTLMQERLLAVDIQTYGDVVRGIDGPLGDLIDLHSDIQLYSRRAENLSHSDATSGQGRRGLVASVLRLDGMQHRLEVLLTPERDIDTGDVIRPGFADLDVDAGSSSAREYLTAATYLREFPSASTGQAINQRASDVILGAEPESSARAAQWFFYRRAADSAVAVRAETLSRRTGIPRIALRQIASSFDRDGALPGAPDPVQKYHLDALWDPAIADPRVARATYRLALPERRGTDRGDDEGDLGGRGVPRDSGPRRPPGVGGKNPSPRDERELRPGDPGDRSQGGEGDVTDSHQSRTSRPSFRRERPSAHRFDGRGESVRRPMRDFGARAPVTRPDRPTGPER